MAKRLPSLLRAALLPALGLAVAACNVPPGSSPDAGTGAAPDAAAPQQSALTEQQPVEWIGYHTEIPMDAQTFHNLASGLFGPDAQAGKPLPKTEVSPGLYMSADADPTTPDQTRITFALDDGDPTLRTIAMAPASFATGDLFVTMVDTATATMQSEESAEPGSGESFYLEYRVASSMGGKLSFGIKGQGAKFTLVLDVTSPRTSLITSKIGQPADQAGPTDSVAGTVWFHLSKDDFDFFVDRAYGKGATSKQNFKDFALVPHDWLRLTVDPHLDQKFVNVNFDLLTADGKRVPVAKAPASVLAGDTFHSLVDRAMTTMIHQEQAQPGSSTPWQIPFYYDDPIGGGVVQVIASGAAGQFQVAYSVETPQHPLSDVPFVSYKDVNIPPPDPNATKTCDELGDPNITLAQQGVFQITFTASDVVKNSPELKGPLKGTIQCSIYHASDVKIDGPIKDAISVQDFTVPDADLMAATPPTFTSKQLLDGDYQILCAQDLDGSGGASYGDPVTLPIGGYTIACNVNPVTVEFAILDPQN